MAAASSDETHVNILSITQVVNYGVLGVRTMPRDLDGPVFLRPPTEQVADLPDENTCIVDPAGLMYIQSVGPSGAGGASGAIYKFLQINGDESFPTDVKERVKNVGDAAYHAYQRADAAAAHVIHTVGPDFRGCGTFREEDAVEQLARVYANVLREWINCGASTLRLLPVSGGIFAGKFKPHMAELTIAALGQAQALLEASVRVQSGRSLHLCIFDAEEVEAFKEALLASSAARGAIFDAHLKAMVDKLEAESPPKAA